MNRPSVHPELTGLHFLLTLQCNSECDHCFVWGSPWQSGTFTKAKIRIALEQARELGTISQIYFEGGEPFIYYPTLVDAVDLAFRMGFKVGVVTNGYWALTEEDALEWLRPFAGKLVDLSVSSDLFHYDELQSTQSQNVAAAAAKLNIPTDIICVAQPNTAGAAGSFGMIETSPETAGAAVMYRGRAAVKLAPNAQKHPAENFTECPHEDLISPGRLHLDPFGNLFICQGILIGNLFDRPLAQIWEEFDPYTHPILGLLMEGGPILLARRFGIDTADGFADACHLCYQTRNALRARIFPTFWLQNKYMGYIKGR